jgi:hypothetical protein
LALPLLQFRALQLQFGIFLGKAYEIVRIYTPAFKFVPVRGDPFAHFQTLAKKFTVLNKATGEYKVIKRNYLKHWYLLSRTTT